jgi:hypothetical protein
MIKIIEKTSKKNCENLLGKFLDSSHYDEVINYDCDVYDLSGELGAVRSEKNIIIKFRKNAFPKAEQEKCYDAIYDAACQFADNRGIAAGPRGATRLGRYWVTQYQKEVLELIAKGGIEKDIDVIAKSVPDYDESQKERGYVWVREVIAKEGIDYENIFPEMLQKLKQLSNVEASKKAKQYLEKCVSKTSYANGVQSNVVGFMDRYPRFPYGRPCAYNDRNPEKFEGCYDFLRRLDRYFGEFLPERYSKQKKHASNIDKKFIIGEDTVFTTMTVNKNFRTASHRDAGDLHEGFSNLSVLAKEKTWEGGYLVLPEYRIAIDIRPGDLLLINNHDGIHGNTEIIPEKGKSVEDMERISIVCYFRETMKNLGSYDYERARMNFVESRRLNQKHPLWIKRWNGVSPNMFESQEWKEYLEREYPENASAWLLEYHPELVRKRNLLF